MERDLQPPSDKVRREDDLWTGIEDKYKKERVVLQKGHKNLGPFCRGKGKILEEGKYG